ncbi:SGNH/GDSL hydrolase family protein [Flagellimonas halotolerans]|uniref:SGNH/GDSL hydrolase family protein n=1 Tax=Flagellimonas halotolerans TaxID=3112164 RepID=A0ABU6IND3_9FLAO|nr:MULTISPECIES: SGNH/GDSL hydrolase family protein [unclassified Allomuricauda]MEC3964680.1 SGNH/GDSL hydrolase family protein [Muricauda sp. SYSU M86414]MEC4264549.1 SGNH/GDSL hydrolase family protein [Muricauda sp. SYSU M84420]
MKKQTILWMMLSFLGLMSTSKINAQDWPNLEKYKNANTELAASTEDENRVVFMGNSITEMWKDAHLDFFKDHPFVNRGIGGQTTPQMLLRFRQDVIDLNPKVVVILAGTNDIAGNTGPMSLKQIHDNILSMVELAKANGIKPIVCSVLPAYDYPWRPGLEPNIKIPKLNNMLKAMTEAQGVLYLDYFSEMADDRNGLPSDLTTDEVHVTKAGYDIMEKMVKEAIDTVLKSE